MNAPIILRHFLEKFSLERHHFENNVAMINHSFYFLENSALVEGKNNPFIPRNIKKRHFIDAIYWLYKCWDIIVLFKIIGISFFNYSLLNIVNIIFLIELRNRLKYNY